MNITLQDGIKYYEKILAIAPNKVKVAETPFWFSIPLYLLISAAIGAGFRLLAGDINSNILDSALSNWNSTYRNMLEGLAYLAVGFLVVVGCRRFFANPERPAEEEIPDDPRDDALSKIRLALLGGWQVQNKEFSKKEQLYDFDFDLTFLLSKANKLFIQVDRGSNNLRLYGEYHDVSLAFEPRAAQISIMFYIANDVASVFAKGHFEYLFKLTWTQTNNTTEDFQGKWYSLGDLGMDFKSSGECKLVRKKQKTETE